MGQNNRKTLGRLGHRTLKTLTQKGKKMTIKIKKPAPSIFDKVNQKYKEALDTATSNPDLIVEINESFHGGTLPVGKIQKLFDIFWKSTRMMRESSGIETGTVNELAHKIMFVEALDTQTEELKDPIEKLLRLSNRNMFFSFIGGYTVGTSLAKYRLPKSETGDNKGIFSEELIDRVQNKFAEQNGWKYSANEIAEMMFAIETTVNQMREEKNA